MIAIAIATGLLCYVVVGGAVIAKDPFSTKVCLKGGGEALGVLIGETSDRTYIGEPRGSKPRHIISIPESEVSRVIVGGHANDIRNAACH